VEGTGEDVNDSVTNFFDQLGGRGHVDLLEKARGTLRIDLTDGKKTEHRLIEFDRGDISVSRRNARADCVFRADRELFGRIARGEANGVTAVLRGEAAAEGDLELLFMLQRVFPTPARAHNGQKGATRGRRRR
jgi:putative sterol carrier protein